MKTRYPLLIIGLILLSIAFYMLHTGISRALRIGREPNIILLAGGMFVMLIIFAAGGELTMVGLGEYQNRYTGSRMFKGILY